MTLPSPTWFRDVDLALYTAAFALVCAAGLALPAPVPQGARVLVLAALWYAGFFGLVALRPSPRAREIVLFLIPLSMAQIFPDWLLSAGLRTLEFPADGGPRLDTINLYMGLLWTLALLPPIWAAERVMDHGYAAPWGTVAAAGAGLATFSACEVLAAYLPLWWARDVAMIGPVAVYVLPAEVVLAVHAWATWRTTRTASLFTRLAAAFVVSLTYAGSLATSWLVCERVLFWDATP